MRRQFIGFSFGLFCVGSLMAGQVVANGEWRQDPGRLSRPEAPRAAPDQNWRSSGRQEAVRSPVAEREDFRREQREERRNFDAEQRRDSRDFRHEQHQERRAFREDRNGHHLQSAHNWRDSAAEHRPAASPPVGYVPNRQFNQHHFNHAAPVTARPAVNHHHYPRPHWRDRYYWDRLPRHSYRPPVYRHHVRHFGHYHSHPHFHSSNISFLWGGIILGAVIADLGRSDVYYSDGYGFYLYSDLDRYNCYKSEYRYGEHFLIPVERDYCR